MSIDIVESNTYQARSGDVKKAVDCQPKPKKSVQFAPSCSLRVYKNGPRKSERKAVWYGQDDYEVFRRQILIVAQALQTDSPGAITELAEETTTLGIEHIVNKRRMKTKQKRRLHAVMAVLDQQEFEYDQQQGSSSQSWSIDGCEAYHRISEVCHMEAHRYALQLSRESANSCIMQFERGAHSIVTARTA
jgi:hypothetical protein